MRVLTTGAEDAGSGVEVAVAVLHNIPGLFVRFHVPPSQSVFSCDAVHARSDFSLEGR